LSGLRVLVVDDEPLAREGLAEQLGSLPGVSVVAVCADGASALEAAERLRPDVLFVDVQMPGLGGFELIEALELDPLPALVFVTAYDAYAIRAFEVHAIDYLLKPVGLERLAGAVARVRRHAEGSEAAWRTRVAALLDGVIPARAQGVSRLIVRGVGQIVVVPVQSVDWIEAADYYSKLHCGSRVHLLRETLTSLDQRLDPARFMRVHRSAIVNLANVRGVEAALRGDGSVVLATGVRVRVTRDRREDLERRLGVVRDLE
jgi:two-component system LytT family response regulator